ncbi:adaptor protein MecA [Bacillus xiapuensis]|uniref:adaptor protein MecA n=1 Tax=Bacillus xiapuensis TaxID=2014075 RepID=UPI000C24A553|nr:adaptor protein MecA [Bacillus xiapuensis]
MMKIERLSDNKVKLTITYEELRKKGCLKKHILEDSFIWHEIFDEMLEAIEEQLKIDTEGMIAIEVHSMAGEELVLILTIEHLEFLDKLKEAAIARAGERGFKHTIKFTDIENVISLVHDEKRIRPISSSLFYFKGAYYLCLSFDFSQQYELFEAVLKEYGTYSSLSVEMLEEYALTVIPSNALMKVYDHFIKQLSNDNV